jgi:hypothetical protein
VGFCVKLPQNSNYLFGAGARNKAPCDRPDPQSGQWRQRHRLGDMRTGKERTDHGP